MNPIVTNNGFDLGFLAFLAYFALVLVLLRVNHRRDPAWLVMVALPAAFVAGLVLFVVLERRFNFWSYATGYSFFSLCFLMAFGAVYKSLSLRILLDLLDKPGRSDSYDNIYKRYLVEDSFQNRLTVIKDKGLVSVSGERYILTARGEALSRRVFALQRLFGISRSG